MITAAEIRQIRNDLNMSQATFADRLNAIDPNLKTTVVSISRYENGKVAPGAHSEAAIRQAADAKPHSGVDRFDLVSLMHDKGVDAVAMLVDDFAVQFQFSLREGVNLLGWEVYRSPVATVFVRRDQVTRSVPPELIAKRAELHKLETDIRRRCIDFRPEVGGPSREDMVDQANRRAAELRKDLDQTDPDRIAGYIYDLERMRPGFDDERLASLRERYKAVATPSRPPVEGVLWINDERINVDQYTDATADPGYPLFVIYGDEVSL